MKLTEVIFFTAFAMVGTIVLGSAVREHWRKRQRGQRWKRRAPQDDPAFGHSFAPNNPERAKLAARVRKVLAANLKIPLEHLQPTDRLNEDLDAELVSNPELFWDLETEFEIETDVEDVDAHEQALKPLLTFADLVDYVEVKVAHRPSTPKTEPAALPPASAKLYDRAIRSIPVLCFTGFAVIVVGILIPKPIVMKLGTGLFLSGFAVWGLANGGGFAWQLVLLIREKGLKALAAHPWATVFWLLIAAFFLYVGGFFVWASVRASLSHN